MSRRSWAIILVILALLVVGSEIYFRRLNANRAGVQIINETGSMLEGLVVSFENNRVEVGPLGDGASVNVRVNGSRAGTLLIDYRQKGNPVAGFQIGEFDPIYLSQGHSKMVLTIKPDQIERVVEVDESSSTPRALGMRLLRWIEADLESAN